MQKNFNKLGRYFIGLMFAAVASVATAEISARKLVMLDPGETGQVADRIRAHQAEIRNETHHPAEVFTAMGWAYVDLSRETADAGYFSLAALCAEAAEGEVAGDMAAKLLQGHAWIQMHRFAEVEDLARILVRERGAPRDYALLADALMEQGKLAEAVEACQIVVDRMPGVEAYARIAQLRWMHGDAAGAIESMGWAVKAAGNTRSEIQAWTLSRWGKLHLEGGDLESATAVAGNLTTRWPDYAAGWLLQGRVALAGENVEAALQATAIAVQLNPLPEYVWWRSEALRAAGLSSAARELEIQLEEKGIFEDPRTVALFLATSRRAGARAVWLAEREIQERADALTYDALAWARWGAGDFAGATVAINTALETGLRDARVWLHAGVIAAANGDSRQADHYLRKAQELAPALMPSEREILRTTQRDLQP